MLELRQLTKIYQTDGGTVTKALDGVTVSLGETGLVFLLGKSGSGKSTMLNLAGGLDEPTEGEVVVMGKSSKNFSGSDFDSYRNTFVGFVFQEYNVLDEFTVEENVALALELQGEMKSGDKVRKILEEVELGNLAKRKPNTLSGGQKQRVAIARALVKEPKIILADEPTGALDSETGKQVFETLKKLSKTRLVLVVSHDRDFAEAYGDRIIELKDGKIISDVCLAEDNGDTAEKQEVILDEEIFDNIRTFLAEDGKKTYKDFLRSKGVRTGAKTFEPTPPLPPKEYDGNGITLIRSRLPFRKAVKIGASGLKLKPFRLVATVFLSVVAFILFGFLSTMTFYDVDRVLAQSINESGYEYVMMEKNFVTTNYNYNGSIYESASRARITPEDVISKGVDAFGAYRLNVYGSSNVGSPRSDYYKLSIRYAAVAPENHIFRSASFEGRYPTAANEIAVSSYFLEVVKNATFTRVTESGSLGAKKKINSASDLIGERVFISSSEATFTVTGVFDSGTVPARFERLKTYAVDDSYRRLNVLYSQYLATSVHSLVLVSEGFYKKFPELIGDGTYVNGKYYFNSCNNGYDFKVTKSGEPKLLFGRSNSELQPYDPAPGAYQRPITFFGENKTALGEREFILHLSAITSYYAFLAERMTTEEEKDAYEIFESACNALLYGRLTDLNEINAKKAVIRDYIAVRPMEQLTLLQNDRENGKATVVGFYHTNYGREYNDGFYCSQEFYEASMPYKSVRTETNYRCEENAQYDYIVRSLDGSDAARTAFAKTIGKKHVNSENDVFYSLDNTVYDNVVYVDDLVSLFSVIFLVAGIVLAVFAALLLLNFISMSITSKSKEIGILRAVGARGADVFKIFFSESGIIVGICILLSVAGTIALCAVLNSVIRTELSLFVTVFVFGPLSAVTMIGIAVAVAVLGTFLPVYLAAKKKPVDSIRAL